MSSVALPANPLTMDAEVNSGETGEEDPPARQQVGDAAAEQQAAAGHQQVGGDEPLQVTAAQLQGPHRSTAVRC